MLALTPLFFWAWLNAEKPLDLDGKKDENPQLGKKDSLRENSVLKSKAINLTKDQAAEIMLMNGFLPNLSSNPDNTSLKNCSIAVQKMEKSEFHKVNFVDGKKPVLLHFWATWCGPCRRELPDFDFYADSQKDINVYVVTSELKDDDEKEATKIWRFYRANAIKNLNVCADVYKISSLLGINAIPVTILISKNGVLLGRFLGATDWSNPELVAAINVYLS